MEIKFTCSAPRRAGLATFLRDQAWMLGLKIEIESEKSWMTENVRCRAEGEESKVAEFKRRFLAAGCEYNSR